MPGAVQMVRTVLGDVDPARLGTVDYHEHLFQISPLLPGDDLADEERSRAEASHLHAAGITTMVDATPQGLGRDPEGLARISAATGLGVVATTGAHRREHYADGHPLLKADVNTLTAAFLADLLDGTADLDLSRTDPRRSPVRAGVLKAGIGYWEVRPFEHRVLEAVAAAHAATGAPVMVHTEHGSAGFEVLNLLGGLGVGADRVVLAHMDRNPDPGLHAELAAAGAYLGYDGMARHREWPDSMLIDCLVTAAAAGAADRILLGGDVARASRYAAYGGMPGIAYLPSRFVPRLRQAGGSSLVDAVLVANPARWLPWSLPVAG